MAVYLDGLSKTSKLDIVITTGINLKDYSNNPIYKDAIFYTAEQVLAGGVDPTLKAAGGIEVSHLSRQASREIGIYLRRLFMDSDNVPDFFIPKNPCVLETLVVGKGGDLRYAIVNPHIDDGIPMDFPLPGEDYNMPDEGVPESNNIFVTKDGELLLEDGSVDYINTIGMISYGGVSDYDDAYIMIENDNDYIDFLEPMPKNVTVEARGGVPQINRYLWENMNSLLLQDFSVAYIEEARQYAILRRGAICRKYQHPQRGFTFYDSSYNVGPNYKILGDVESVPITSVMGLLFARLACRNLTKKDPDFTACVCFKDHYADIEWDENTSTISVGNYKYSFETMKQEYEELQKEEATVAQQPISVIVGQPHGPYDLYVADFARMQGANAASAQVMHVSTHPMKDVLAGKYNSKLHKNLCVDFSGASNERELATELLDMLEQMVVNGEQISYDTICLRPNTVTASIFAHVM